MSSANRNGCVTALHADGTCAVAEGLFDGQPTRPANSGDTISLYTTGFGTTAPTATDGRAIDSPLPIESEVVVRFGDVRAGVAFAGLIAPGLYQLAVIVPAVDDGDVSLTAGVEGKRSQECALLTGKL